MKTAPRLVSAKRARGAVILGLMLSGLANAAVAQQSGMSDRSPRPAGAAAMQAQKVQDGAERKPETEADRKLREMDRRLGRVMRSICNGC